MKLTYSLLSISLAAALSGPAFAAPAYRDVNGATAGSANNTTQAWDQNTTANWSTDSTGSIVTDTYQNVGGPTPDAIFSAGANATGASTVTIDGAVQANSILVEEGTVTFAGTNSPVLTLGGGGITIASTAGATTTIGTSVSSIVLNGAQNWDVNNGGTLLINGTGTVISGAGPITINNASTATGQVTIGPTSGVVVTAGNTFTGGVIVKGGTLAILASDNTLTSVSTAGSGSITLGDTTGSRSATLTNSRNSAVTITNNIVVQAGSSGLASIVKPAGNTNQTTYTGSITMNKNLTIEGNSVALNISSLAGNSISTNGNVLTLSGTGAGSSGVAVNVTQAIVGNGSVVINNTVGAAALSGTNTYSGGTTINGNLRANTTVANGSSTGTGAVSVSATGVLSGTGAVGAATTGMVTVSGGGTLQGGVGAASGTLTVLGSTALQDGSVIRLTLATGGAHSTLALPGGASFDTDQAFTFNSGVAPGFFNNIITGLLADPTTTGAWMAIDPEYAGSTFVYENGNIDLNLVPEPTTGVLLFSGLGLLIGLQRSRRSLRA